MVGCSTQEAALLVSMIVTLLMLGVIDVAVKNRADQSTVRDIIWHTAIFGILVPSLGYILVDEIVLNPPQAIEARVVTFGLMLIVPILPGYVIFRNLSKIP